MLRHRETAEERRNTTYHPDTARDVLSRAAQLQEESGQALSPEQLETLAAETGIAPRYVRRALSEQKQRRFRARRSLSRRDRRVLGGIPLMYGLLLFTVAMLVPNSPGILAPTLVFFLPPFIAFLSGAYLNSKRLGALSGALIISCMIGGILAAMRLQHGPTPNNTDDLLIMAGMMAGGIGSGLAGAGLRQFSRSLRRE